MNFRKLLNRDDLSGVFPDGFIIAGKNGGEFIVQAEDDVDVDGFRSVTLSYEQDGSTVIVHLGALSWSFEVKASGETHQFSMPVEAAVVLFKNALHIAKHPMKSV